MSAVPTLAVADPAVLTLQHALVEIAARAGQLDSAPSLPAENLADLAQIGALAPPEEGRAWPLHRDVALVRAVARADASTARILDGHLNGVERLVVSAPAELRDGELAAIAEGRLRLGVWGADPAPGEGTPARLAHAADGSLILRGVKTFGSGAGGVQRARVVAGDLAGAGGRRLAYVDTTRGVQIDRDWYRASGLRASESHRVEFEDTPVLALLGIENELLRQPWFARDAVRTAATWAGIADGIVDTATLALCEREADASQLRALGRMRTAQGTIDRWLEHATAALDAGTEARTALEHGLLAIECRAALTEACRAIAAEAAQACGSRALVDGGALDRGRRDLDLFLLQHRLDPQLVKLGRATLEACGDLKSPATAAGR
jgi:hypothetical protein